jgi:hypothetical protein
MVNNSQKENPGNGTQIMHSLLVLLHMVTSSLSTILKDIKKSSGVTIHAHQRIFQIWLYGSMFWRIDTWIRESWCCYCSVTCTHRPCSPPSSRSQKNSLKTRVALKINYRTAHCLITIFGSGSGYTTHCTDFNFLSWIRILIRTLVIRHITVKYVFCTLF